MTVIAAPVDWVESISELRFPTKADHRRQHLMDRNNNGELLPGELEELESLVELSERLALAQCGSAKTLGP